MKQSIQKLKLELLFSFGLILGLVAIANAQNDQDDQQKKIRVEVEVTEDGKTTKTVQELDLHIDDISRELENMVMEIERAIEEAAEEIDNTNLQITIDKDRFELNGPDHKTYITTIPNFHFEHSTAEPRPFLGVIGDALSQDELLEEDVKNGVRLSKVVKESAAEEAGLKEGDIITELNGEKITSFSGLAEVIRKVEVGDELDIRYVRDGKKMSSTAELKERRFDGPNVIMDWNDEDGRHRFVYPKDGHEEHIKIEKSFDRKAFLGIEGQTTEEGVRVNKIFEHSTAEEMGLEEGDVITSINGEATNEIGELVDILSDLDVEDEVKVEWTRDGKQRTEKGNLEAFPHDRNKHRKLVEEYSYTFKMDVIDAEEIADLEERSGEQLDQNNALEIDEITLSPNPSKGIFLLDVALASKANVEMMVFDTDGRKVMERSIKPSNDERLLERIDLTEEPNGMYYLSLQQEGKGSVKRLVKH